MLRWRWNRQPSSRTDTRFGAVLDRIVEQVVVNSRARYLDFVVSRQVLRPRTDTPSRRRRRLTHPKLGLYKEVKTLEATLNKQTKAGEPRLVLNAFILSPTKFSDLLNVGDPAKKQELEDRHVLFMEDGRDKYLGSMFARIQ